VKVAFLLKDIQLSGGVGVVVEHARQLALHHAIEPVLVRTEVQDRPDWPYRGLDDLRIARVEEVRGERFDVAVATWWETTMRLFEVDADRHAYFVQLLEDSHYPLGLPERLGFQMTLALPVRLITEARWIAETLERLQPGTRVLYVRNGIAKDVFASPVTPPPARDDEPLKVLVEGSPTLTRKGVPHALEAVRLMREPRHVTLVTPEPPDGTIRDGVREHLGALPHAEMARLMGRHHVLLKLSRAEGMYGPPLEAFHMGATCVTTPVTGHEEYVRHGENALVVDWDDPHGTARALDLLARDRRLLHRLRTGALATAGTWPSWEQSSTVFAAALRRIAADPSPDPRPAGHRHAQDLAAILSDADRRQLDLRGTQAALAGLRRQRAVRAAFAARRAAGPVLRPAKRVARRALRSLPDRRPAG
jgi:glycosyltransferase involved in cell wall biosynthesis